MYDYKFIVISAQANPTEKMLACLLRAKLSQLDKRLMICTDKAKTSQGEIVIGHTNRLNIECGVDEYVLLNNNGNLYICADNYFGYEQAFSVIEERIKRNSKVCSLTKKISAKYTESDSEYFVYNKNEKLRAMYFNIYGWGGKGGVELRTNLQDQTLKLYAPDCVGFQEFENNEGHGYRDAMLPYLIEQGYVEVPFWYEDGRNSTPIFYNPRSLTLCEYGGERYNDGMNDESKGICWAIFSNSDNDKFVFVNTHFAWPDPKHGYQRTDKARQDDANQIARVIDKIVENYGELPLLMGGDLNCFYGSQPISILQASNLKWLYDCAQKVSEYGYHHYSVFDEENGYFTKVVPGEKDYTLSMDFVFAKEYQTKQDDKLQSKLAKTTKLKIGAYITAVDTLSLLSSDHAPKIIDFSFEK